MSIAAAFFTKQITIARGFQTEVSGELVNNYMTVAYVNAAARPMSAVEKQGLSKEISDADYRFYTNPIDIRPTDRVYYDGRTFEVMGKPINVMEMGDHIMINAKEII